MVAVVTIWHGSTEDAIRLADAIGHHCRCLELKHRCPAHELMLDQYWLDHVIFLRWLYLKGEYTSCAKRSLSSR